MLSRMKHTYERYRKRRRVNAVQRERGGPPAEQVFCLGFHKTGTTSLASALETLGYHTIHGDVPGTWPGADEGRSLIAMIQSGNYELPTFDLFDAFTDHPYFWIWREIDARRSGRFILTLRDEEPWIESCVKYYAGRRVRPMREWAFAEHADPSSSAAARAAWLDSYRRHNEAVQAHFEGRPDFCVLRLTEGEGWDPLCRFLGRDAPKDPFPHRNKR